MARGGHGWEMNGSKVMKLLLWTALFVIPK